MACMNRGWISPSWGGGGVGGELQSVTQRGQIETSANKAWPPYFSF